MSVVPDRPDPTMKNGGSASTCDPAAASSPNRRLADDVEDTTSYAIWAPNAKA